MMASIHITPTCFVIGLNHSVEVIVRKSNKHFSYPHVFKKDCKLSEQEVDYALFSPTRKYFAALYSDKVLCVWRTGVEDDGFEKLMELDVKRRSTSLAFNEDESAIFVADKSGDLYTYDIKGQEMTTEEEVQPVLGHVSMLLDVAITKRHIVTADRDEKIRVSNKEHPYVIDHFCLGHTEFVLRLSVVSDNLMISCSGDATVRLWEIATGRELQSISLQEIHHGEAVVNKNSMRVPSVLAVDATSGLAAIACFRSSVIQIFQLAPDDPQPLRKLYDVTLPSDASVLDCDFDKSAAANSSVALYVLFLCESKLKVRVFSCTTTGSSELVDDGERVGSTVERFSTANIAGRSHAQLFKCHFSGDKYAEFRKKKQQPKKSPHAQGNRRKKPKLES